MLILVAHGSRDHRWRGSVRTLAEKVGRQLPQTEARVAFMQFDGPSLPDVVAEASREGHGRLRLLPLFMASAGHVDKDIKPLVRELSQKHPDTHLELLAPVGEDEQFPQLIIDIIGRPS